MYASPQQRSEDIERGATRTGPELVAWFDASAMTLAEQLDSMPDLAWATEVVTAQGRLVPVSESPWMRSRELFVHAVDLATGIAFADLPTAFLSSLRDEILAKRASENLPELVGDLSDVTAYLVVRFEERPTTGSGLVGADQSGFGTRARQHSASPSGAVDEQLGERHTMALRESTWSIREQFSDYEGRCSGSAPLRPNPPQRAALESIR